jgi:hypothetical protein
MFEEKNSEFLQRFPFFRRLLYYLCSKLGGYG